MKVGYFGTWERGYPRNEQVISALRGIGVDVSVIHEDVWQDEHKFDLGLRTLPVLIGAQRRLMRRRATDHDVLVVGYPGQFDLWMARRQGPPVVFNAMVSLYEALVEDRRRFRHGTAAARAILALDRYAFRAADLLVADTAANARYMAELASLTRVEHVFVGAEDRYFTHAWERREPFTALFVGKLIPLHGLRLILETAALLPDIPFRIVGSGQEERALESKPSNVQHVKWVPYRELSDEYARAGCALGIFGAGAKTERVIPNKAFQALAVGTPLVTADTPAVRELLTDGLDALLVKRDPTNLATAIRRLADDGEFASRLGRAGRRTYEAHASETVLGRRWLNLLESLAAAGRTAS
jgi:glycosyltransferase involved in cell wall biosynthesis